MGEDRLQQPPTESGSEKPSRRGHWTIIVIAGGVVFFACALLSVAAHLGKRGGPPAVVQPKAPHLALDQQQLGEAEAKVEVIAVLPLDTDCHSPTIEYLLSAAKGHPGKLRVRFVNLRSAHGVQELVQRGMEECASVIVNGRIEFEDPEDKHPLTFSGPAGEAYSVEDLRIILQQELARAYGDSAPQLPPSGSARAFSMPSPAEAPAGPAAAAGARPDPGLDRSGLESLPGFGGQTPTPLRDLDKPAGKE